MKNNTILNLFVEGSYLEVVTKFLVDYPVVVKKIGRVYRVQLVCYYVGYKKGEIEINYYDEIERDYKTERINVDWFIRFTTFAKELTPDDFEGEYTYITTHDPEEDYDYGRNAAHKKVTEYMIKKTNLGSLYGSCAADTEQIKNAFNYGTTHADMSSIYPKMTDDVDDIK